jgi:hypothetical protein
MVAIFMGGTSGVIFLSVAMVVLSAVGMASIILRSWEMVVIKSTAMHSPHFLAVRTLALPVAQLVYI